MMSRERGRLKMKLVILRQNREETDLNLKFAIELPDKVGEIYKEDFLKEHFLFYLEMALADLSNPAHVPIFVAMNKRFLLKKAKVVWLLDSSKD